ncbi:MAG TPA: hypothetical protein VGB99_16115 [Acidobacteriota bacterium]
MSGLKSVIKRLVPVFTVGVMLTESVALAVDKDKAMYVGGTISVLEEKSEGTISTRDEEALLFTPKKKDRTEWRVKYDSITSLEYGQKAGRRVAVGILVTPWALFSKKRKHYLTIAFRDDAGKEQAGVFELGKDIVRTTLAVLEVKSGKDIEYQDDEARKSAKGN